MKHLLLLSIFSFAFFSCTQQSEKTIYSFDKNSETRWISFENQNGEKGKGGMENNGAKGHPCDSIGAGVSKVLMDIQGSGIINRMWFTISERYPKMLRSLKFEIYWDGETKPAVSAPFGDFFGVGLGRKTAFESELFADPEGRSFVCFIQMPFKKSAKIVLTNESDKMVRMIFYDINYSLTPWKESNMYFHSFWNRDTATTPGVDYQILPAVKGKGRFLGVNVGVNPNPVYGDRWWGEGEVKMYLDGDGEFPTLVGTGTEDYIASAWGQGIYSTRYTGCTVADKENNQYAFYRFHIPDPIFFKSNLKVTIQQMGGALKDDVIQMMEQGINMIPVTYHDVPDYYGYYEKGVVRDLKQDTIKNCSVNFYRSDDVSSTAYFYLDKPKNDLPELKSVAYRIYNLKTNKNEKTN